MLSPTTRITGAAACAKAAAQTSAAASAVNQRSADRNEDDEVVSTWHCRGAYRDAQKLRRGVQCRGYVLESGPYPNVAWHCHARAELALTTRRPQLQSSRPSADF